MKTRRVRVPIPKPLIGSPREVKKHEVFLVWAQTNVQQKGPTRLRVPFGSTRDRGYTIWSLFDFYQSNGSSIEAFSAVANAEDGRPAGAKVNDGAHCALAGYAPPSADRSQDALLPVETEACGGTKADETPEREDGRSEEEGQGRAVNGRLHAGVVGLACGGNG